MPSPFPGMDPYLEESWGDVRARLVVYARDLLQPRMPERLRARLNEVEYYEQEFAGRERRFLEPATYTFIEILDISCDRKLVTEIDVFNKEIKTAGDFREQYIVKKLELRRSNVSLVEIDLLRSGEETVTVPHHRVPVDARTPFKVCVHRGWWAYFEYFRISLRERMPTIAIPLRETDTDVALDLQALMDQCYRNGGYDEDIDYRPDPRPPLEPEDAAWADELLRSKGMR